MIELRDAAATEAVGATLAPLLRLGDVVALSGDLGVGKTTLARGLISALGHDDEIASPTFPIILPYDHLAVPLWHVDLYRIEDETALHELGLGEALTEGALLIEWPERMGARLWPHSLMLRLDAVPAGRRLTSFVPPSWGTRWPPR